MHFQYSRYTLLLFLLLTGCSITKNICPCEAPEMIRIDKKVLEIKAILFRSNARTTDTTNLRILIQTIDKTPIPKGLEAYRYYLRSSKPTKKPTEGTFSKNELSHNNSILELDATLNDIWDQNETAEIAVQLVDGNGKTHFIRKEGVMMENSNQ